jgi:deoxyribodipyrimidine photo-lyase
MLAIFWFRRDLRLEDNAGLYHALKSGLKVLPIFIFDKHILDELSDKQDRRVVFIHQAISDLQKELQKLQSTLVVRYGSPADIFQELLAQHDIKAVYTNHDYEPYAQERDQTVGELLQARGISFHTYKDQCIFEKDEVLTDAGKPYSVFTPYSKKWKAKLNDFYLKSYPTEKYFQNFASLPQEPIPTLEQMGFVDMPDIVFPDRQVRLDIVQRYHEKRDFPAQQGTTRLSVHLRFGTVSIRALAQQARQHNETWLNELIWRDFYMMILWQFPQVGKGKAFKEKYDTIEWRQDKTQFEAWCAGQTGYPIVDAGMRELNATGFMHNRVRMVVASFLTKHLLIDWRWGEAYFAQKLLDFDLSANNGGWQWASGSGCDAAPYFRIFNPASQTAKFDSKGEYIRKWVPEINGFGYPKPIVEHSFARNRALATYKKALGNEEQAENNP